MSGSWTEKPSDSYRMEVTWMFSREEMEELRTGSILRKSFDNDLWQLTVFCDDPTSRKLRIQIMALSHDADLHTSSSTEVWIRDGQFRILAEAIYSSKLKHRTMTLDSISFDAKFSWSRARAGKAFEKTFEEAEKVFDRNESFGVRCILTSQYRPLPDHPSSNLLFSFFDNPSTADTVFVVHSEGAEPRHLLACKALLSEVSPYFKDLLESETVTQQLFDLNALDRSTPGLLPTLFERESKPFFELNSADDDKSDESQEEDEAENDQLSADEGKDEPEPPRAVDTENASTEDRPKKKVKLEEAEAPEPELEPEPKPDAVAEKNEKMLSVVEIHDTEPATFRALVAFLHVPLFAFYSIQSNFLLEIDKAREAGDAFEHENSPETWFPDNFSDNKALALGDVSPCSPYDMYRLATKFKLDKANQMTLDYIVRSLTVENVAYELFTPLSLEHKQVQEAILKFFVKNWLKVKKTKAFKRVLDKFSSGELANGRDLMEKIFDLMKA